MSREESWDDPDFIWVTPKQRTALDNWADRQRARSRPMPHCYGGGLPSGWDGPMLLRKTGGLPRQPSRHETHAAVSRVFDQPRRQRELEEGQEEP